LLGPLALKFAGDFQHAYSRAPGQWAILGYEAMRAVLFAIQRAGQRGNDRTVVTNRFLALRARRSALGTYSMEPTGDSTLDDLAAYRVRTGALAFERTVRGGSQGA
jgi:ABC-type branched-subunit amino acid transport system substrate-binding protein